MITAPSTDGKYVAEIVNKQLIIRNIATMVIQRVVRMEAEFASTARSVVWDSESTKEEYRLAIVCAQGIHTVCFDHNDNEELSQIIDMPGCTRAQWLTFTLGQDQFVRLATFTTLPSLATIWSTCGVDVSFQRPKTSFISHMRLGINVLLWRNATTDVLSVVGAGFSPPVHVTLPTVDASSIAISETLCLVAVADLTGVYLVSLKSMKVIAHKEVPAYDVAWSADMSLIVSSDSTVLMFSPLLIQKYQFSYDSASAVVYCIEGKPVQKQRVHPDQRPRIFMSATGEYLAIHPESWEYVWIWQLGSTPHLLAVVNYGAAIRKLQWQPDNKFAALLQHQTSAIVWEPGTEPFNIKFPFTTPVLGIFMRNTGIIGWSKTESYSEGFDEQPSERELSADSSWLFTGSKPLSLRSASPRTILNAFSDDDLGYSDADMDQPMMDTFYYKRKS